MKGMAASMEKKGMEIQRKFDLNLQSRAKWDKYAAEMKVKYNSI